MKVYHYCIGSCRGSGFSEQGTADIDVLIKKIEAINSPKKEEDFPEDEKADKLLSDNSWIGELLYNCKPTKKNVLKVLKAIKRRKRIIEAWEEGTTGASILKGKYDRKALRCDVKCADRDALDGESLMEVSDLCQ